MEGQQQTYWCTSIALTYPKGNFGDRNDLLAWHGGVSDWLYRGTPSLTLRKLSQDVLVQTVASVNPNTIVAVNSVGPIIMENWIDNENGT